MPAFFLSSCPPLRQDLPALAPTPTRSLYQSRRNQLVDRAALFTPAADVAGGEELFRSCPPPSLSLGRRVPFTRVHAASASLVSHLPLPGTHLSQAPGADTSTLSRRRIYRLAVTLAGFRLAPPSMDGEDGSSTRWLMGCAFYHMENALRVGQGGGASDPQNADDADRGRLGGRGVCWVSGRQGKGGLEPRTRRQAWPSPPPVIPCPGQKDLQALTSPHSLLEYL